MAQSFVIDIDEPTKRIAIRWNEMRRREELVDFTLYNDNGDEVKGHMLIMALSCREVKSMIYLPRNYWKIYLIHISAEAMEQLMNFMYIYEIEISSNTVEDILFGALILRLHEVERLCLAYMRVNGREEFGTQQNFRYFG